MSNEIVSPETHNQTGGAAPTAAGKIELTQVELDELKFRAEVSSQNFERLKKAQEDNLRLEAELESIRLSTVPSNDDGETVRRFSQDLAELKAKQAKTEVIETYPVLREVWSEFEKFHQLDDNKGLSLKTAAKAFVVEKDLLGEKRQGLEKPTGGGHAPVSSGMSSEDAKRLRETDYKKYREMLLKGQLKVS